MSKVSLSGVRQRIAAAIVAGAGSWKESRFGFEQFAKDTSLYQPDSFAVGVPESLTFDAPERRRTAGPGLLLRSRYRVGWSMRMRGDNQVADYDTALDGEAQIVGSVMGMSQADLHVLFDRSTRTTDPDGWVHGVIFFDILHRFLEA